MGYGNDLIQSGPFDLKPLFRGSFSNSLLSAMFCARDTLFSLVCCFHSVMKSLPIGLRPYAVFSIPSLSLS